MNLHFTLCLQHQDFVIINKPAGISVHKDNENVLIVAHGMTLTVLTAVLKGLDWSECRDEEKHKFVMNTAINIAKVENGKVELVEFNNIDHLV